MRSATNWLDGQIAASLLRHGAFLSDKIPAIGEEQALELLEEAVLDDCVREFRGVIKGILSGCQVSDFQATPEEMQAWLADRIKASSRARCDVQQQCPSGSGGTASYSNVCKEVDEKMKFDMQSKLDEYMRLLEQIKQKTEDERTAVSLLQEVSRDRRAAEIREERGLEQSVPASEKQKNFMKSLKIKFPATVTKQEASTLIDEELAKNEQ